MDSLSHYLNEEDLPDHYSRLKERVAVMRPADLTIVGDVGQGTFGAVRKVCYYLSLLESYILFSFSSIVTSCLAVDAFCLKKLMHRVQNIHFL